MNTRGLWRGHRTSLINGSRGFMPDTPALQKELGQPAGQKNGCGFLVAHLPAMFDASGKMLMERIATPLRTHDLSKVWALHPFMRAGHVVVVDRGFCSHAHVAMLFSRGIHAVFRIHRKIIVHFRSQPERRRNTEPGPGRPRSPWLRKWGQEDPLVQKELAVCALVYNLAWLVRLEAARRQRVRPNRIRFMAVLRWPPCTEPGVELPRLIVNLLRPGRHEPPGVKGRPKEYDRMTQPRAAYTKPLRSRSHNASSSGIRDSSTSLQHALLLPPQAHRHPTYDPSVNAGSFTIAPPFKADSCAQSPTHVQLADCRAFGNGSLPSTNAVTNSCTRCGCEPP